MRKNAKIIQMVLVERQSSCHHTSVSHHMYRWHNMGFTWSQMARPAIPMCVVQHPTPYSFKGTREVAYLLAEGALDETWPLCRCWLQRYAGWNEGLQAGRSLRLDLGVGTHSRLCWNEQLKTSWNLLPHYWMMWCGRYHDSSVLASTSGLTLVI